MAAQLFASTARWAVVGLAAAALSGCTAVQETFFGAELRHEGVTDRGSAPLPPGAEPPAPEQVAAVEAAEAAADAQRQAMQQTAAVEAGLDGAEPAEAPASTMIADASLPSAALLSAAPVAAETGAPLPTAPFCQALKASVLASRNGDLEPLAQPVLDIESPVRPCSVNVESFAACSIVLDGPRQSVVLSNRIQKADAESGVNELIQRIEPCLGADWKPAAPQTPPNVVIEANAVDLAEEVHLAVRAAEGPDRAVLAVVISPLVRQAQ